MAAIPNRVLETTLTGRNLLSPMLAKASADVTAFNSTVARANGEAAGSASVSAARQEAAAAKVAASNVKASTSASASAQQQMRAHTRAAESATLSARLQETANRSLAASNGLLGTSLTPITAGLGAVGLGLAYAGYRGMEFGTAMSQVQAASQASAADMGRLKDAAVDAGAKTQYSAVEAAQGITEMSKAGVSARDILGGGLTGALNLAAAGQISVADAAETGATALSVFNLKGDQMSHVADLLAAGAGKAQGSVGDMSAALNQSALVAAQMGLSIEDTTGALAMFAHNGLIGSDAGTSFKSMLQRLNPQSAEAATLMDQLGLRAYDAQGNFVGLAGYADRLKGALSGMSEEQRNATLNTLFGSDAIRAASILYKEGAAGVQQWAKDTNDVGYSTRQAAQLTDNLQGDLERLGGAFDSAATSAGNSMQPALRAVVEALTGVLNVGGDVLGFLADHSELAVALGGILAVQLAGGITAVTVAFNRMLLTPAVLGLSNVLGVVLNLPGAFSAASAAVGSFAAAAAPLVAVGAVVYAISKTVEFATAAGDARDEIAGMWAAVDDASAGDKAAALAGVADQLEAKISGLKAEIGDVKTGLMGGLFALENGGDIQAIGEYEDALRKVEAERRVAEEGAPLLGDAFHQVAVAAEETKVATEEAAKAQEDWLQTVSESLQSFVDPLGAYKGLLDEKTQAEQEQAQATADATKSSKDSWKDYVKDVDVSLGELADRLEQQLEEQANWRTNIAKIAQWAGEDVANYLLQMGKDGVDIVAKMADGTTADAKRMATDIGKVIQNGGNDWAAGMDNATKVMAIVGRDGAKATRAAIAKELGIGVGEVQAIADKYGVALATGINPVLSAIGKKVITLHQQAGRTYVGMNAYADGGFEDHTAQIAAGGSMRLWAEPETGGEAYIPLAATKRGRSRDIWREVGQRLGVEFQEFAGGGFSGVSDVPHPPSTAPFRAPISTAADGVMAKEYADVVAFMNANAFSAAPGPGGSVERWRPVVLRALSMLGQSPTLANGVLRMIQAESGGNPNAINLWDSNARAGHPSRGLMQTIPTTFEAWRSHSLPDNIVDPLANIYSGINYALHRYGAGMLAAGGRKGAGGGYIGYDSGGLATSAGYLPKQTVKPERVLSPRQTEAFERWMASPAAMPGYGAGGTTAGGGRLGPVNVRIDARVFVGNREITDIARVEAVAVLAAQDQSQAINSRSAR